MEGKVRPRTESGNRRPLCMMGGPSILSQDPDVPEEVVEEGRFTTPKKKQLPDIIISPDGTGQTEAAENGGEGDDEDDEDESEVETEATSNADHLSSRSSPLLPYPPSSPSPYPRRDPLIPRQASPLTRPPLAVLVDSQTPTKLQSYQVSAPSPKLANVSDDQSTSPLRLTELDVWMGVVLPKLPERSRYSLPNVRLGEF